MSLSCMDRWLVRAACVGLLSGSVCACEFAEAGSLTEQPGVAADAFEIRVPGTTVSFELVRCPRNDAVGEAGVPELWVLTTEVPWELYDIYVYGLDAEASGDADAIARPSKPYVPPDRGFGHEGYPAMGMTRAAAEGFCAWLTASTGVVFRLPTAEEWTYLALGDEPPVDEDGLDAVAWTGANAEFTTHPVAHKPANGFGLHDMLGNVAEWVSTETRRPIAMGGSYRDPPEACHAGASQRQERSWNASDPQIPKSSWWLADCSWVGFRFVTEHDPSEATHDDE